MNKNFKRILVIDPALISGYCFLDIYQKHYVNEKNNMKIFPESKIHSIGYYQTKNNGNIGSMCNEIKRFFLEKVKENNADEIAFEEYFFSKKFANGSMVNVNIRTSLMMMADEIKIPYTIIKISDWKKSVSGRVMANKEEKKQYGKKANKIFIMMEIEKKFDVKFPKKIRGNNGRMINLKYDMVDCIGQAICYAKNNNVKENDIDINLDHLFFKRSS